MIELPDFENPFFYENGFYLSCDKSRIGKMAAHYELFKMAENASGDIVECGVFRGASLMRFAALRDLFGRFEKRIIGFDSFGKFPETGFYSDMEIRERFVKDTGGGESISISQLEKVIRNKGVSNIELVEGDITETVPRFLDENQDWEISLLNLDVDIYEPSVVILETIFPRISKNGVLVLDDYNTFPGETQAVDDYFSGQDYEIKRFPFSQTPCYLIKK